jgi:hypothetical protein
MTPISSFDPTNGRCAHEPEPSPRRLRELAHWYREFADRTGNPTIWESRLKTAEKLEHEANRLQEEAARQQNTPSGHKIRSETQI